MSKIGWQKDQLYVRHDGQRCVANVLKRAGHVVEARVTRLLAKNEVWPPPATVAKPPLAPAPRSLDPEALLGMQDWNPTERAIIKDSIDGALRRFTEGKE